MTSAPALIDATFAVVKRLGERLVRRKAPGGETSSARYCYSVWLRHLVKASKSGFSADPNFVVELGPGASVGVGYAALLSGAERYVGLDSRSFERVPSTVLIARLLDLFRVRARIPDEAELPDVYPALDSYDFPAAILTDDRLERSLNDGRVASLAEAVSYHAPWHSISLLEPGSVDFVLSQAVMEHVTDLDATYAAIASWLRPGGLMSHQIDFRCHGTSLHWAGHWTMSRRLWTAVRGSRSAINRQPLSAHVEAIERAGLRIHMIDAQVAQAPRREDLHKDWLWLSDDDIRTAGAFVQAVRVA